MGSRVTPPKPMTDNNKKEAQTVPTEESRIVIRPDGEVVIENLSESLAEVALELDPDAEAMACRIDLVAENDDQKTPEKDHD